MPEDLPSDAPPWDDHQCAWCHLQTHMHWHCQRRRLQPGQVWDDPRRDHFALWLFVGGHGQFELAGQPLAVRADSAVLVPVGLSAKVRAQGRRELDIIHIPFELIVGRKRIDNAQGRVDLQQMTLSLRGLPVLALQAQMGTLNLGQRMLSARHHNDHQLAQLDAHIQLLRVIYMFRASQLKQARQTARSPIYRAYIYLLDHRSKVDLCLEEVASHVGVSVPHLTRRFRQQYGESPMKVLARERLWHAKRLLATPEFQVAEIASLCGFGSSAYFCRAFRADTGQTPSEFRRQQMEQAGLMQV